MIKQILTLVAFCIVSNLVAQNTVGLLSYDPSQSYDGYTMIYPHNQPDVFLLNNCGEIVHTWVDSSNFRPGNTAYLRPDGKLVKTKRDATVTDDVIWAGGGGEIIEIRDWDNNLEWTYTLNDSLGRLHHDIALTPDNTILAIAWEYISFDEAVAAGRDTATMAQGALWPDKIIEIDPATDAIIWEWRAWEHLIQDHDSTKANYGVVADNPGKINLNYDNTGGEADWHHANAIDYDPQNKQILLSVPEFHEIWIIDHSTTAAEVATSAGGLSGKGGDLMYRWGNPAAYNKGTAADQKLFYQHDPSWVTGFAPANGMISVFNNRIAADYSGFSLLDPAWEMYEWAYVQDANDVYLPSDLTYTRLHPDTTALFSTGLSSMQLLPNGNTLVTSGRFGYTFEITEDDEIVWEFKTPRRGTNPATQGDTLAINNNLTFRSTRFSLDYAAFDGRDLTPKGYMELEPDTSFCDNIMSSVNAILFHDLKIYPNPAQDMLVIEWEEGYNVDINIYDFLGRDVATFMGTGGKVYRDISALPNGVYYIAIRNREAQKLIISR